MKLTLIEIRQPSLTWGGAQEPTLLNLIQARWCIRSGDKDYIFYTSYKPS